eukprot:GHVS01029937.1.p1 GENE.GHVS01029937.1~~GHVS01029937.1.p1  ORF type:complete len:106 (-),score=1.09 GHVS01029937.1:452-769(-)
MRVLLQRVREASVSVNGEVVGRIGKGLVCLLGIATADTWADAEYAVRKSLKARIWPDTGPVGAGEEAKAWHASVVDQKLEVLVVSQFTLFGTLKKGNKPDFHGGN